MKQICCFLLYLQSVFFQAYDHHLNMILGDVEETVTTIEIDEETYEEVISHFKFASFLKRYAQFFLIYILLFQNIFLGIPID